MYTKKAVDSIENSKFLFWFLNSDFGCMEMQPLHKKKKREFNFQVSAALILYWHSGKLNRDGGVI